MAFEHQKRPNVEKNCHRSKFGIKRSRIFHL